MRTYTPPEDYYVPQHRFTMEEKAEYLFDLISFCVLPQNIALQKMSILGVTTMSEFRHVMRLAREIASERGRRIVTVLKPTAYEML